MYALAGRSANVVRDAIAIKANASPAAVPAVAPFLPARQRIILGGTIRKKVMHPTLKLAFEAEIACANRLIKAERLDHAFRHLERAHVLGQKHVVPHVRSHWAMLRIAIKRSSITETQGQAVRIVIGALGSAIGIVPIGNTGGTNISMFCRLPIDSELAHLLKDRD